MVHLNPASQRAREAALRGPELASTGRGQSKPIRQEDNHYPDSNGALPTFDRPRGRIFPKGAKCKTRRGVPAPSAKGGGSATRVAVVEQGL